MSELKITLVQSSLHWEDKEKNLSMFEEKLNSITEATDLIVLPEMFTTGFSMNAQALAEKMSGLTLQWLKRMAVKKNCFITGSLIIEENGKFYNRLIWMRPDGFETYDKRHLFSLAGEEVTYSPGNKKIVPTINNWRILPLVCYDLRFPVWSRRTAAENYDLLLYVANWPEKRIYAWKQLLIARAIENQSYVVGINRTGNDGNNMFHPGCSAMIDFKGEASGNIPAEGEFIKTITLQMEPLVSFRKQFAFFDDRDSFFISQD